MVLTTARQIRSFVLPHMPSQQLQTQATQDQLHQKEVLFFEYQHAASRTAIIRPFPNFQSVLTLCFVQARSSVRELLEPVERITVSCFCFVSILDTLQVESW